MKIRQNIKIGFEGIVAHKLRAFLTMLGIIFGVGAVVAMLSIGEGARREAIEQIELMGMNNIIIQDADLEGQELIDVRAAFSRGLTLDDVRAVTQVIPDVIAVIPLRREEREVFYGSDKIKVNLIGTTADYPSAHNMVIKAGYFPAYDPEFSSGRICALGSGVKRSLFPFSDPVGKDLKIKGMWFRITGVMENKEVSVKDIGGYQVRDFNLDVLIPVAVMDKFFDRSELQSPLDQIIVKIDPGSDIRAIGNILQRLIGRRHREQEDFKVIIPEELMRQSQSTQRIFNIVMGAIASISLLVGGIGIMNIMLSSVLERTREIGIRRAIGAKRSEILGQFLTESVTLSFSGGLAGIIVGIALAKVITYYAGWVTVVSVMSVFLAFGVATAVGLVFGIYPAKRAANLHPIEALRYE